MDREGHLAELERHIAASLGALNGAVAELDGGQAHFTALLPRLRVEMGDVLGAYQAFKHGCIFDPGIASGTPARAASARDMKVACIAAGETFRVHMNEWPPDRIAVDWARYKVAARLTANHLGRHIRGEADNVAALIRRWH